MISSSYIIPFVIYLIFTITYLRLFHPQKKQRRWLNTALILNLIGIFLYLLLIYEYQIAAGRSFLERGLLSTITCFIKCLSLVAITAAANPLLLYISGLILIANALWRSFLTKNPKRCVFYRVLASILTLLLLFFFITSYAVHSSINTGAASIPFASIQEINIKIGNLINSSIRTHTLLVKLLIIAGTFLAGSALVIRKIKRLNSYFILAAAALGIIGQIYIIQGNNIIGISLFAGASLSLISYLLNQKKPVEDFSTPLSPSTQIIFLSLILTLVMLIGCFKLDLYPILPHPYETRSGASTIKIAAAIDSLPTSMIQSFQQTPQEMVYRLIQLRGHASIANGAGCPLYLYPTMIFLKIFPIGLTSLRLSPVFTGILSVLTLFLLVRLLFNEKPALIAAFLLAVSFWQLSLIRLSVNISATILFSLLCYYLFWKAILSGKKVFYLLLGITVAQSVRYYVPTKSIFPLIIIFFIYMCFVNKDFLFNHYKGFLVFVASFLFMTYLQEGHLIDFFLYWKREGGFAIWEDSSHFMPLDSASTMMAQIQYNLKLLLEKIYFFEYPSIKYAVYIEREINFNFIIIGFATLGFLVSLFKAKNHRYFFLCLWLLFSASPGLFTRSIDRRFILMPAPIFALSAVFIYILWKNVFSTILNRKCRAFSIIIIALAAFYLLTSNSAAYFYSYYQAEKKNDFSSLRTRSDSWKLIHKLMDTHYLYLAPVPFHPLGEIERDAINFLSYFKSNYKFKKKPLTILNAFPAAKKAEEEIFGTEIVRNFAVVAGVGTKYEAIIKKLQKLYPHLSPQYIYRSGDKPLVISFAVSKKDILALESPKREYRSLPSRYAQ